MSAIIESALGDALASRRLLSEGEVLELLTHTEAFPALPENRLFLEFEVDDGLALKGYGHGYGYEQFCRLVEAGSGLREDAAGALRTALERDPFLDERGYYLADRVAGDPEWIEYDWDGRTFGDQPAVFFMIPARLRSLSTDQSLAKLAGRLTPLFGGEVGEANVPQVLATLREHTSPSDRSELAIYRMGLSDARKPGWMKLVLNGVGVEAIERTAGVHLDGCLDVFPSIVDLYQHFGGADRDPIIAASMDCHHGVLHAMDVECPYFNGMPNHLRGPAVSRFLDSLVAEGRMDTSAAEIVKDAAYARLEAGGQGAWLMLNHLKFGIAGATKGRIKLYFELVTERRPARPAVGVATRHRGRPTVVGSVDRVDWAELVDSPRWSESCSAEHGRPLHITKVPQLQRLSTRWTDRWIVEQVGDHPVDLDYSSNGVFPGGAEAYDGVDRRMLELPIDEVIRRVHAGGTPEAPDSRLYVYGANTRPFERLLEGYTPPMDLIGEVLEMHTQFWLGGQGTITPAHFDVADNLLCQIRGTKKILLWPPGDYPHLYVNPTGARYERNSNLGSLEDVDFDTFPEFRHARAISCDLEAGEMLYIPLGWFHYVQTTAFTVSVNHFWHAPSIKPFLDSGFFFLRGQVRPELMSLMIHLMTERQGHALRALSPAADAVAS